MTTPTDRPRRWRAPATVAALLVLLVLGALPWGDRAPPAPPGASASARAATAPPTQDAAEPALRDVATASPPAGRVERAAAPEADLTHPFVYSLGVYVCGGLGVPIAGASVFVAPPECGFARWPMPTGESGDVRLTWRGRQRVVTVTVAVLVDGVLQPARQVQVEHATPAQVAFGARARRQPDEAVAAAAARSPDELRRDAARVLRARADVGQGRLRRLDELDVLCGRTMLLFEEAACVSCHEPGRVRGYRGLASCGTMVDDLHPGASFEDLGARAAGEPRANRRGRAAQRAEAAQERQRAAAQGGYVVGVVRDGDGAPVGDVPLCSLTPAGALDLTARSAPDGRFRLGPFGDRDVEVLAASGPLGFARAHVQVAAGQDTPWSPSLAPFQTVAGRVLDERGAPLAGWFVELRHDAGDWAAVVQTARDGSFAMHGVPGTVACYAWPRHAALGVPVLHGNAAMVGARDVVLALHPDAPTRARLRVHVEVPAGTQASDVDARAVHLDSGAVARLLPLGHEDAFEVGSLPPGRYVVQLGAVRAGWITTGEVAVDGRGLWDLGRFALPAPGQVELRFAPGESPPADGDFAFYRRTPSCDVLSAHRPVDGGYQLPPGPHVLVWRKDGHVRAVSFEVTSHERTELALRR